MSRPCPCSIMAGHNDPVADVLPMITSTGLGEAVDYDQVAHRIDAELTRRGIPATTPLIIFNCRAQELAEKLPAYLPDGLRQLGYHTDADLLDRLGDRITEPVAWLAAPGGHQRRVGHR